VPTILYLTLWARGGSPDAYYGNSELAPFLPPPGNFDWLEEIPPPMRLRSQRDIECWRESVAKLAQAGVTLGVGTDIWQIPDGVHTELEELVTAGLSPLEAIRAATGDAARILGAERDLGTIEAGKLADLVILDADPTVDIKNTRRIGSVIQNGRIVDRAALRARGGATSRFERAPVREISGERLPLGSGP